MKTKEGFFMSASLPDSARPDRGGFQKVVDAFLSGHGLPFAHVLSAQRIERIFRKHGGLLHGGRAGGRCHGADRRQATVRWLTVSCTRYWSPLQPITRSVLPRYGIR